MSILVGKIPYCYYNTFKIFCSQSTIHIVLTIVYSDERSIIQYMRLKYLNQSLITYFRCKINERFTSSISYHCKFIYVYIFINIIRKAVLKQRVSACQMAKCTLDFTNFIIRVGVWFDISRWDTDFFHILYGVWTEHWCLFPISNSDHSYSADYNKL